MYVRPLVIKGLFLFFISFLGIANVNAELNICSTIRPLYSLVQSVTEGVYNTQLLISKPNSSPHHYSLSPSELNTLANCDIIFLIDNELEYFLPKAIKAVAKKDVIVIEIAKQSSIDLLSLRDKPFEGNKILANKHHEHEDGHNHSSIDLHIWLNPQNAKNIVKVIAENLAKNDAIHEVKFKNNAQEVINKLEILDQELATKLLPYKQQPYLVFHDAYQYFDTHYQLNYLGAFAIGPDYISSAKNLALLKDLMIQNRVSCIFSEPEFSDHLMQKIADTTQVKIGVIDAEWGRAEKVRDTEIYFMLMQDIADNFIKCMNRTDQIKVNQ